MKGEKKNKTSTPKLEKIGFSTNTTAPKIKIKNPSKKYFQ